MITKARIKLIKSLEQRKQRNLQHLFVAEGPKLVGELLATMQPDYIAENNQGLSSEQRETAEEQQRNCRRQVCFVHHNR